MSETRVGEYLLLEAIGSGGLGEVFRARDTREGRTVALKLLPPDLIGDAERSAQFIEDAQLATALSHPAIAALYEVGEADGRLFLASEYAPGELLRAVMAQGPIHPKQAVSIVLQVADALADAHAAGIIHRDIRPDNIIVTPKGRVKVLDFGLANWTSGGKVRENAAAQEDTTPAVLETVAYMSPEQALGQGLDARTDIYSLGVVFYQMLTGLNPFAAATPGATLIGILKETPRKPSEINKEVPCELDPIVMKMLSREVQERYGSAAVVASDLRAAYGERTEHVFEPDVPDAAVRPRRRWLVPTAALSIVAAVALGGYSQRREARRIWRQWFGTTPAPVLALIPLNEIGQSQTTFADTLTDDLAMRLGQTAGLRVLGRSATREYRGRQPSEVAQETGAAVILTGTVARAEGDLKITLELIDPSDGVPVWRQEFVNQAANVLAAETVIADEVARALRVPPAPTELHERTMARTVSPEAYDLYARARDARVRGNVDAAVDLFDKAARQDEGLAEAYAGLAEALHARALVRGGPDKGDQERARQVASRAAAIEPDLAAVELAAGFAAPSYRDALRHFARAARQDPSSGDAFHELGDQLIHVDTERAIRMYERSRSLDPRRVDNYADLVFAKVMLGNRREAAGEVDALQRAMPRDPRAALLRARVHAGTNPGALVDELQKAATRGDLPPAGQLLLAERLVTGGRTDDAARMLRRLAASNPAVCEGPALLSGLLGPESRGPAAEGATPGCAALGSAAVGDAPAAAAALRRIAQDEQALRSWMQIRSGTTWERALEEALYPWNKVAQAPEVVAARGEIRAAYAALKKVADDELKTLP